jgi:hypothetical protein
MKSREAALKDDFTLENTNYGYDDEDDDWGEDESNWNAEDEAEVEEATDVKDESTAYLEFLNEEVSFTSLPMPVPV